jgi:serine/threonine protein phosphatase 1
MYNNKINYIMHGKKMSQIEKYPVNKEGRDFVVGDIHGMFSWLIELMKKINFDSEKDRLFAVGDLVDRGPESHKVQSFLKKKWFHSVRGNHEDMIINREYEYGMHWLQDLTDKQVHEVRNDFAKMPIMIEVETSYGKIGIVHAEVPDYIDDWNTFKLELSYNGDAKKEAMWGRTRITDIDYLLEASDTEIKTKEFQRKIMIQKFRDNVKNISYTFHGHSVIPTPVKRGNQLFIDTGAALKYKGLFNNGALTILEFTDENKFELHRYSNLGVEIYEKMDISKGMMMY